MGLELKKATPKQRVNADKKFSVKEPQLFSRDERNKDLLTARRSMSEVKRTAEHIFEQYSEIIERIQKGAKENATVWKTLTPLLQQIEESQRFSEAVKKAAGECKKAVDAAMEKNSKSKPPFKRGEKKGAGEGLEVEI